jgi:hypothetical protein
VSLLILNLLSYGLARQNRRRDYFRAANFGVFVGQQAAKCYVGAEPHN